MLFDVLHRLSQGSLESAREALSAELELDLESELLLQLLDFDVLRPAGDR